MGDSTENDIGMRRDAAVRGVGRNGCSCRRAARDHLARRDGPRESL